MFVFGLIFASRVLLVTPFTFAHPLDASSYILTKEAADKYMLATRELMAAGVQLAAGGGQGQGNRGNPLANLDHFRAMLDQNRWRRRRWRRPG